MRLSVSAFAGVQRGQSPLRDECRREFLQRLRPDEARRQDAVVAAPGRAAGCRFGKWVSRDQRGEQDGRRTERHSDPPRHARRVQSSARGPALLVVALAFGTSQALERPLRAVPASRAWTHRDRSAVTGRTPRHNVQNKTMDRSAWSLHTPQRARAFCTPDISRRDRKLAPIQWRTAARGQQSIAALRSQGHARQFPMPLRNQRLAASPTIAPGTRTRRCARRCSL